MKPNVATGENSCVLYDLYSEIVRKAKHENTASPLLFVLHLYLCKHTILFFLSLFYSSPLKDLMKVYFQRFGNLPRNLFISFEVFNWIQQFISHLFNTSTCSDDSSKSEPRPINHRKILFQYDHLLFLAYYLFLLFGKAQNLEGKIWKKKKKLVLMHVKLLV